jgi:hypothetical protein
MTARQQLARLLPLALLVVLVIVGLRGVVAAPAWNGPLRSYGVPVGIAAEVVFCVLLAVVRIRERAARRAAARLPYSDTADQDIQPPQALRFVLSWLLAACVTGVAVVLLTDLHLHFFSKPRPLPSQSALPKHTFTPPPGRPASGGTLHIPVGPILYTLLVIAIVAAVVVSIWWSTRLRRPAQPLVIEDIVDAEQLRAAVAEGQAALAAIDDARAAIIACYLAMEGRLADRGTARAAADTPDELLARAVAAGTVRGAAAGRLTALFYEARFSSHPLGGAQRDAASTALDELAAELAARQAADAASTAAGSDRPAGSDRTAGSDRPAPAGGATG